MGYYVGECVSTVKEVDRGPVDLYIRLSEIAIEVLYDPDSHDYRFTNTVGSNSTGRKAGVLVVEIPYLVPYVTVTVCMTLSKVVLEATCNPGTQ